MNGSIKKSLTAENWPATASGFGPRKKYRSKIPPMVRYTIPGAGVIVTSVRHLYVE